MRDELVAEAIKAEKELEQSRALALEVQSQYLGSPLPTEIDPETMPPYPLAAVEGAQCFCLQHKGRHEGSVRRPLMTTRRKAENHFL